MLTSSSPVTILGLQGGDFPEHQPRHAVGSMARPCRRQLGCQHDARNAHLGSRPRRRCANTFGPAAASSEFTMRSAPSTTGSGTKACSATPTISTMARTRTAWSRSSPRIRPRRGSATSPFETSGTTLSRSRVSVKFLATVDENSLATKRTVHPGHGDFHPVAWCQYYDGGRSWVTSLGHDGQAFTDGSGFPGQQQFKKLDRQRDSFGDGQYSFLSIKNVSLAAAVRPFQERGSRLGLALFTSTALERVSASLETNQPAVARAWARLEVEPGFFVDALASEPIAFRPFNHVAKAGTSGSPPSVRVSA